MKKILITVLAADALGLAVDPKTKTIYFGDILEGRIYKVTPQ